MAPPNVLTQVPAANFWPAGRIREEWNHLCQTRLFGALLDVTVREVRCGNVFRVFSYKRIRDAQNFHDVCRNSQQHWVYRLSCGCSVAAMETVIAWLPSQIPWEDQLSKLRKAGISTYLGTLYPKMWDNKPESCRCAMPCLDSPAAAVP